MRANFKISKNDYLVVSFREAAEPPFYQVLDELQVEGCSGPDSARVLVSKATVTLAVQKVRPLSETRADTEGELDEKSAL